MAPLEVPYRPRQASRKEIEQEKDWQQQGRERWFKRRKREAKEVEDRSSKLVYSNTCGIAFRDFTLGPSGPVKTRAKLDREAYAARRAAQAEDDGPVLEVPRLSTCCLAVIVENYGELGMFDRLDPAHHRQHAGPLLDILAREVNEDVLPFQVWLDFACRFKTDLPAKRRTYRGLCVSDIDELAALREINEEATQLFAQEAALSASASVDFIPPFFLAYLDLTGEVGFGDADIYKLKDPLSHFLAVLRLDGTSVSDEGLRWIGRAADDAPRYGQLQVLSLKNLTKVTDEGVIKLAKLNLRSLDLRMTRCSEKIRRKLNDALVDLGSTSAWRVARQWDNLPAPHIELQLFDSFNFSPSRVLTILHYLASYFTAPASARPDALNSPLVKPVAVHLSSMSRVAAPSSSPTDAVNAEKTVDELYREHLALQGGSTHAAHHRAFGAVTSTMALSRKQFEEDAHAESDKGAAFRLGNDSVAAGQYIGREGKAGGGRATLYDVGNRKVSAPGAEALKVDRHGLRTDREPFSDSEDEDEKDREEEEKLERATEKWDAAAALARHFYLGPRPVARPPRTYSIPPVSPLMLVRPLPYRPPYEPPVEEVVPLFQSVRSEMMGEPAQIRAGATLMKKRRRGEEEDMILFSPGQAKAKASPVAPPPPPPARAKTLPSIHPSRRRPPLPASSSSPSIDPAISPSPARATLLPSTPRGTAPAVTPSSSNPFSKTRPALSTPRHAQKNIVKTGPNLAKRSGLTAFRAKK
ncbi:hypothetical protein JCM11251_001080 [Rhodosporidiobolus azoricus]